MYWWEEDYILDPKKPIQFPLSSVVVHRRPVTIKAGQDLWRAHNEILLVDVEVPGIPYRDPFKEFDEDLVVKVSSYYYSKKARAVAYQLFLDQPLWKGTLIDSAHKRDPFVLDRDTEATTITLVLCCQGMSLAAFQPAKSSCEPTNQIYCDCEESETSSYDGQFTNGPTLDAGAVKRADLRTSKLMSKWV